MTVRILTGDSRAMLKTLPDDSVHCCVTSPPYWGLRSYLPPGHPDKPLEIGSEPTVEAWVATMVEVFAEVRRVLRPDGTLWLNLGDSYAGSRRGGHRSNTSTLAGTQPNHSMLPSRHQAFTAEQKDASLQGLIASRRRDDHPAPRSDVPSRGCKPKDMVGQPWLVAFALREAGWWLRQEIIWAKRSPMPESARDRLTKSHEHVFLLAKSEKYYFDFKAIQEPASMGAHARMASTGVGFGRGFDAKQKPRFKQAHPAGWAQGQVPHEAAAHQQAGQHPKAPKAQLATSGNDGAYAAGKDVRMGRGAGWRNGADVPTTRNPRTVRVVDEDEYAQFLEWKAQQQVAPDVWTLSSEPFRGAHFATFPTALAELCIKAGCPPRGTVLDPFGGSGTVGLAADRLHRNAVLIDLDPRCADMAEGRITEPAPLLAQVER